MNVSLDRMDLINSYKCYMKSKNLGLKTPDLFFNLSIACKYLERFEEAYEGFKISFELDSTFTMAKTELESIENCFEKMKLTSKMKLENETNNSDQISISNFLNLSHDELFEGELTLKVIEKIKFSNLL